MLNEIPTLGTALKDNEIDFLKAFTKSCRRSIIEMLKNSQSGHPGGSLSSLDYLSTLYSYILSQTGEKVVISHGHISPAAYSVLAELDYIDKNEVINTFRKFGSPFEGHVTRHVPGIFFGTGPLGVGVSAAAGFAIADRSQKTYGLMGDGEVQEGQVFEMINFAKHHKLNNLVLFVDYNKVQLTASLEEVQNIDIKKIFEAGDWNVIECDGHDFQDIWNALSEAQNSDKPVLILGNTIMGKGVDFMEVDGEKLISGWHGKPPTPKQADEYLEKNQLTETEIADLKSLAPLIKWKPEAKNDPEKLSKLDINTGEAILYTEKESCRNAYGKALANLAKHNKKVIALTADLKSSVMTKYLAEETPDQHIECGIAEQNMVTIAGAMSLSNYVPFVSTFGAFLTSRPKDQARVNDINNCNVKMVATHCGLSVGEDGPTHQAIDDMGIMLGHYRTMILDPADPNHCDRLIRYIASHYGNFYIRMGRHGISPITKEDGSIFYDENYEYEYGKCDRIREGDAITIVASGSMVEHALKAHETLTDKYPNFKAEIIVASSIKKFDQTLIDSIEKTKKVITVEDHNAYNGLGSQVARTLLEKNVIVNAFKILGTKKYELSGKPEELWKNAGIDHTSIENTFIEILNLNE
jgi:transketolase